MPLTPDDIQNKRFTVVRFGKTGYDEEEVDSFLDDVEAEMRRLIAEGTSLKAAAAAAAAAPAPTPAAAPEPAAVPTPPAEEPNETALRTLLLAQRTADEAIAQAKAEADQVVNDARGRAAALERDAQTQHQTRSAALAAERQVIEAEISDLRNFEREYRTRLRAYLEGQLGELEKLASSAPAMAPRPTTPAAAAAPPVAAPITAAPVIPAAPPAAAGAAPAVPPVAPPAVPRVATTPPPGPFSSAPAPSVAPPAAPVAPSAFDTDVDAGSDVPSGPPAQADDVSDEAGD